MNGYSNTFSFEEPRRTVRIEGYGVTLRSITRDDVDRMALWTKFSEPDLAWANVSPVTKAEKDLWYWQNANEPTVLRLAIVPHIVLNPYSFDETDLHEPELIGVIGLRHINYDRGEATLGIRMSASTVGRGIGTAAIMALLSYSFGEMNLHRVVLDVDARNVRAQRCYLRCGFTFIGKHRSYDGNTMLDMDVDPDRYRKAQSDLTERIRSQHH